MGDRELLAAAHLACQREVWDRCINTSERTKGEIDIDAALPDALPRHGAAQGQDIGLDPAYVYGLIRQETRFIMDARSGVGASGLMQLMPATARWTARKIGMPDFSPAMIADHDTNLTHRHQLPEARARRLRRLDAAGRGRLQRRPRPAAQLARRPDAGAAIWAENVPFNETRDYVKKVLANTTNYAALISGRPQSLKERLGNVGPRDMPEPDAGQGPALSLPDPRASIGRAIGINRRTRRLASIGGPCSNRSERDGHQLYIGNKNYSSWSMRPWVLHEAGRHPVRGSHGALRLLRRRLGVQATVLGASTRPARCRCWSTTASRSGTRWPSPNTWPRRFPDKQLWPPTRAQRARARSVCAEMHCRLRRAAQPLRHEHRGRRCPRSARGCWRDKPGVRARRSTRIVAMWSELLDAHGGPFLFGDFGIADAYFAPVVTRMRTYGLPVPAADRRLHRARAGAAGRRAPGSTTRWPSTTSCLRGEPYRQR